MEGLRKRILIVAGVLAACGAYAQFGPRPVGHRVDERWMEQHAPEQVDNYTFMGSVENPAQSYRMDEKTYQTLEPSGIVARIYQQGNEAYDVVLISSDNSKSFHDPRVCFNAQGWSLKSEQEKTIHTKTRGDIPVTYVKTANEAGQQRAALFFYRSPNGFVSAAKTMRLQMFMDKMIKVRNEPGVFYRIIPLTENVNDEQLFKFAADYLDTSGKTSQGFF